MRFDYCEYTDGPQSYVSAGRRILCKGGGGSPSTTTTISKSEPPAFVQPWSEVLMQRGASLSESPYNPYTGQKLAEQSPETAWGLNMTANRAISGSPLVNEAQQFLGQTVAGGYGAPTTYNPYMGATTAVGANAYSGANPYLENSINRALGDVQSRVNSQFNNANYGSTAHQETLARMLGDTSNAMRLQDYTQQQALAESDIARRMAAQQGDLSRNATLGEAAANRQMEAYNMDMVNRMRAAMFAPQMAQQDYADAQALLGVGDARRALQQEQLNQMLADWTEAQQDPYKKLDTLASTISTASGGYANSASSAPNPYQTSPVAGMIGGGMAGYGLGNAAGFNPYMGAAGGALLGGLL